MKKHQTTPTMQINKPAVLLTGLLGCCLPAFSLHAQDSSPPFYQPLTLGAEIGTTGYGGTGIFRFADNFGVGGGIDYFYYNRTGSIKDVEYDATVRLMSEPVTLYVYPWARHSFYVRLGAAFNQNRVTGTNPNGTFTLNGNTYAGTLNLDIQQQAVDPYLSLGGNLYFDRGHHVSLGAELGAMYTGKPRVGLTSSNPAAAADVASEVQQLQSYANKVQFYPVIKLSLNISF
jgi:hypothetical protein